MTYLYIAVILFALILFFFLPFHFGVQYIKNDGAEKVILSLQIFGMELPISLNTEKKSKKTKQQQEKLSAKDSLKALKNDASYLKQAYPVINAELKDTLSFFQKHLVCENTSFQIHFGFSNAAKTGIMNGVVWTVGTIALKALQSLFNVEKIKMEVYPNFTKEQFKVLFRMDFRIRPIQVFTLIRHIMKCIHILNQKNKAVQKNGRTSN